MKYKVEIDIDLPRDRVIELFDSTENLYKWQDGLQSFEHISGDPGQAGAKSKLVFKMGKRNMELVETITKRELPDEFNGTYDTKGVFNVVNNRFTETAPGKTRWESENEFQFQGFMKVIGFVMKGAFPKQSLKYMKDFKAFAEDGKDVRES
ncbi:MAG: SRPBCC family protein [Planctomycetota bacterium]